MMGEEIKIASLNVNGINNFTKRNRLFHLFNDKDRHKFDIILVQETKLDLERSMLAKKEWYELTGGQSYWAHTEIKNSSGVAILLNNSLKHSEVSNVKKPMGNKVISIEIKIKNVKHQIICTYAPGANKFLNKKNEKTKFFENLATNYFEHKHFTIWGGDHNAVEDKYMDTLNVNPVYINGLLEGAHQIKTFKSNLGMEDPYRNQMGQIKGPDYTYIRQPCHTRIDRIYIPANSMAHADSDIELLDEKYKVDHKLIWTSFITNKGKPNSRGKGIWKMNKSLLKNEEFDKLIKQKMHDHIRNIPQFENILFWWESLKSKVIRLNAISFSKKLSYQKKKEFTNAKEKLNKELSKNSINQEEVAILQGIIAKFEFDRQESLRVMAHEEKVEFEESSSAYFFKKMQSKSEKCTIEKLKDDDGNIQTNPKDILDVTHKFYKDLYDKENSKVDMTVQDKLVNQIDKKLSDESRDSLEAELTLKELETALKKSSKNKTPGSDGIPVEFYQKYQKILLPHLLKVAIKSQELKLMPESQREAIITLLFKAGEKDLLKNYRPISLCNSDYKLITKAFSMRLQKVLPDIISENQTAGIPNRTIFNNLWLLRDMFDYSFEKNEINYLFSLDMTKAFDFVNHEFMYKVLRKFGFGDKFLRQIETFYTHVISRVQNNGYLSPNIDITRGVRQGCPLSFFIYIITAEILSISIRNDKEIKGFKLPARNAKPNSVSVMLYADDTVLPLAKNKNRLKNKQNFEKVYTKLKEYELASGAVYNMSKSKIFVFGGKSEEENELEAKMLREDIGNDSEMEIMSIDTGVKILGIKFFGSPQKTYEENYLSATKKMENEINFSKLRDLTLKGKILVLNSKVLAKLWFIAAVIPLTDFELRNLYENSPNYLQIITKMCKDYLDTNLEIKDLEQPVFKGGLNLASIGIKCLAMRAKQLNLIFDKDSEAPASNTAWYWLSRSENVTKNFHNYTRFISQKNPDIARFGPNNNRKETTNLGYKSLSKLCNEESFKKVYKDFPENIPNTKKVGQLLQQRYRAARNQEVNHWKNATSRLTMTYNKDLRYVPQFRYTFKDLSSKKCQETLWKIKKFTRVYGDSEYERNPSRFKWKEVAFCRFCKINGNNIRESHFHTFSSCPKAQQVWNLLEDTFLKIDPNPPKKELWFLGSQKKGAKGILFNTFAAIVDHQLWLERCSVKYDKKEKQSAVTIAIKTKNIFKLRIASWHQINKQTIKFMKKYGISTLFTQCRETKRLIFKF